MMNDFGLVFEEISNFVQGNLFYQITAEISIRVFSIENF